MRNLVWDTSFQQAFRRATRRNVELQERILQVLAMLSERPFEPELKTHKLRGWLDGLWACFVEYDCRRVFAFEPIHAEMRMQSSWWTSVLMTRSIEHELAGIAMDTVKL